MALDLPALDRPAKATSMPSSEGHWSKRAALVKNVRVRKGESVSVSGMSGFDPGVIMIMKIG